MDHNQAVETMAAERYLLNQLTIEDREAFEEHFFTCSQCALDLRAAAAFLQEAKAQLPTLNAPSPVVQQPATYHPRSRPFWWRPAVILPAFITLLAIIGFQSLATVKGLRTVTAQPRLVPRVLLQASAGSDRTIPVDAMRGRGVVLLLDLPQPAKTYTSYTISLRYPDADQTWSQTVSAATVESSPSEPLSLLIPALGLEPGPYRVAIYGVTPSGQRSLVDRSTLEVEFHSSPTHS